MLRPVDRVASRSHRQDPGRSRLGDGQGQRVRPPSARTRRPRGPPRRSGARHCRSRRQERSVKIVSTRFLTQRTQRTQRNTEIAEAAAGGSRLARAGSSGGPDSKTAFCNGGPLSNGSSSRSERRLKSASPAAVLPLRSQRPLRFNTPFLRSEPVASAASVNATTKAFVLTSTKDVVQDPVRENPPQTDRRRAGDPPRVVDARGEHRSRSGRSDGP